MNVQRTEYQQMLETTIADDEVRILHLSPIFLWQNNVASPK